jgi:hypothetical protein
VGTSPDRADALALAISGHLGSGAASQLVEGEASPRVDERKTALRGWSSRR